LSTTPVKVKLTGAVNDDLSSLFSMQSILKSLFGMFNSNFAEESLVVKSLIIVFEYSSLFGVLAIDK
jgi:hypothetical protein